MRYLLDEVAGVGSGGVGVSVIGGMASIGKTSLAVHAAHRLAQRFPDGQVFLSLHGHTPGQRPVEPAAALLRLLEIDGVAAYQIPRGLEARAAMWRTRTATRRLLVVLDDATDEEQVRMLLPAVGSLVLVTSRQRLSALDAATSMDL